MAGTGRGPSAPLASRLRPVHAVGLLFVANGLSLPPLLPRFPQVKDAVEATEASFGLALLGTGVGGILGASAAPAVMRAVGGRRAAVVSAVLLASATLGVAVAGSIPVLFLGFAAVGLCDGVADTTQNHLLFDEQRRSRASLTSRMHALWSVGALVGTGAGTLAAARGVGVTTQTMVVAVVAVSLVLLAAAALRRTAPATGAADAPPGVEAATPTVPDPTHAPSRPLGRAALRGWRVTWGPVAAAAVAVAAIEGVGNEWSALTLRDGLGASAALAGAGPTAFAGAMLLGRLLGDRVIDAVGVETASRAGAALVALGGGAGLAAAAGLDVAGLLVAGLLASGVGAAVLFPSMLAAGDRVDASGRGVAVASSAARAGFLVVPVLVGTVADVAGLPLAFAVMPLAGAAAAVLLPAALRRGAAAHL